MRVRPLSLVAGCVVVVLSVASLAAGADDLRLVEAVKNRELEVARALLTERVDVNTPLPDGATALHWAVHWNELDMAERLLGAGARVDATNDYGVTPLSLACTNGSARLVEELLAAGANPNAALLTGETVLMTCARTGIVDAVSALLARGADVEAVEARETFQEQTALMWAAAEGHAEVTRVLIEHGADIRARSTNGFTPLLFAARKGDLETTQVLLSTGVDIDEAAPDGATALVIASLRGETEFARFLLDEGADPNLGPGFSPLHWAAGYYVTELSDNTSGILAEDSEWSYLGGFQGDEKLEFVRMLLAHGADVNARAEARPSPYVGGYVGGGNRRGRNSGATPFLLAAAANDLAVMRVLLEAGADSLVATNNNTTPLMVAAGIGYTQGRNKTTVDTALRAATLCLELGADVNAINEEGETALHGAAYRQDGEALVRFLVEDLGADMNVKSQRGWTPLVITEGILTAAFYIRAPQSAELLRKLGAEPSPPDVIRDQPTIDRLIREQARQTR